ncbi:amidohydrolase family protein [bacterium BD-1]|nr:amidohydrolase family protein [Ottowia caeni]
MDAHLHIYDARFPYDDAASLRPPEATVAHYRQLQSRLGTTRCVVVQPSSYGTDNRCLVDALQQLGAEARGVAVIDERVTDRELRQLHESGVRGIRFNLSRPAGAPVESLQRLARRIEPLGWHVQVHALAEAYPSIAPVLAILPTTVVIDHLGRIPPSGSPEKHPAWDALRRLVDAGRTWIKVSGAYHDTKIGPPGYEDTGSVSRAWLRYAPQRTVWGTDWPHVAALAGEKPMPDDAQLLDLTVAWLPETTSAVQLFVDNPRELYGFQVS